MSAENEITNTHDTNITTAEVLFGILLGIGAISGIWVTTTLVIHLLKI